MPKYGKFIVFEGPDGSGNSTQAKIITDWLEKMNFKVLLTKEPTSNIIGGLIKGQLSHDWKSSAECLQLLFAADRAHHLEKEIIPALKNGYLVVSDRYLFSSIAYGKAAGLPFNWLIEINKRFILPDLTFFFKVSSETCISRLKKSRFELELFEERKRLFLVWRNYNLISKKFKNIFIINGEGTINEVSERIKNILIPYLKLWKKK